jgi:hypothetical protein
LIVLAGVAYYSRANIIFHQSLAKTSAAEVKQLSRYFLRRLAAATFGPRFVH